MSTHPCRTLMRLWSSIHRCSNCYMTFEGWVRPTVLGHAHSCWNARSCTQLLPYTMRCMGWGKGWSLLERAGTRWSLQHFSCYTSLDGSHTPHRLEVTLLMAMASAHLVTSVIFFFTGDIYFTSVMLTVGNNNHITGLQFLINPHCISGSTS